MICCVHVLDDGLPILRVSHDSDGDWQMQCAALEHDDGRVLCFQCMIRRDETIAELASLPRGWGADRDAPGEPWVRAIISGGGAEFSIPADSRPKSVSEGRAHAARAQFPAVFPAIAAAGNARRVGVVFAVAAIHVCTLPFDGPPLRL